MELQVRGMRACVAGAEGKAEEVRGVRESEVGEWDRQADAGWEVFEEWGCGFRRIARGAGVMVLGASLAGCGVARRHKVVTGLVIGAGVGLGTALVAGQAGPGKPNVKAIGPALCVGCR